MCGGGGVVGRRRGERQVGVEGGVGVRKGGLVVGGA